MLYRLILQLRKRRYDRMKGVTILPQPVVCIGNITVGGTGKTPHTELVLRLLEEIPAWKGKKVAVLSRGYGRKSKGALVLDMSSTASQAGDEPRQIKRKFPDVDVVVCRDRIKAAGICPADIYVMDDGFQYRALKATLNVVLVDSNRPVWKDCLLPFGRLRDLKSRLSDADVIIMTKCVSEPSEAVKADIAGKLGILDFSVQTMRGISKSGRCQTLLFTGMDSLPLKSVFPEAESRYVYSAKSVAFSGIADDRGFLSHLRSISQLQASLRFPDHHSYTPSDISSIMKMVARYPTAVVVTTEKDAQRILNLESVPDTLREKLFYVPIEASFFSEESREAFADILARLS